MDALQASKTFSNVSTGLRTAMLQLLAYRLGQYDPAPALDKVEAGVREVVLHMTQRDPAQRKTASEYLQVLAKAPGLGF